MIVTTTDKEIFITKEITFDVWSEWSEIKFVSNDVEMSFDVLDIESILDENI